MAITFFGFARDGQMSFCACFKLKASWTPVDLLIIRRERKWPISVELGSCRGCCPVRRAQLLFLSSFLCTLDLVWWTKQDTPREGAPALKSMNVPVEGKGKK